MYRGIPFGDQLVQVLTSLKMNSYCLHLSIFFFVYESIINVKLTFYMALNSSESILFAQVTICYIMILEFLALCNN